MYCKSLLPLFFTDTDLVFQLTWELQLLDTPPGSPWLTDLHFSLSHLTTGQLLTVPGSHYPEDWGQNLLEVAGTRREGPASTWRIKYFRAPTVGWFLVEFDEKSV